MCKLLLARLSYVRCLRPAAIVCLTVFVTSSLADAGDPFRDRVEQSILEIDDVTDSTSGTGFLIYRSGDTYLGLSAGHVLESKRHQYEASHYPFGFTDDADSVRVIAIDRKRDLALFELSIDERLPVLRVCRNRDLPSSSSFSAYASGFPKGRLSWIETRTLGTTRFKWKRHGIKASFWRVREHKQAKPGISGAPLLVRRNGAALVVGCWFGSEGDEARCSLELQKFLKDEGYGYVLNSSEHQKSVNEFRIPLLASNWADVR